MRPLLLHASASGTAPGHRRVVHLEYAAEPLPGGLEWYQPATEISIRRDRGLNLDAQPGQSLRIAEAIQACSASWRCQGRRLVGSDSTAAELGPWRISPRRYVVLDCDS